MSDRTYTFRFTDDEMTVHTSDGLMDESDIVNITLWACHEAKPHAPRAAMHEYMAQVSQALHQS